MLGVFKLPQLTRRSFLGRRAALMGSALILALLACACNGTGSNSATVPAPVQHSATLRWDANTTPGVTYNVYRGTVSGGPYTMINNAPQASTSYVDLNVQAGQTYYYVVTAVDNGMESVYSNQVTAVVPM